jgi:hypothetical protein
VGLHKVSKILGPLRFLLSTNDLLTIAIKDANIILFADDASITITSPNDTHLTIVMTEIFIETNK